MTKEEEERRKRTIKKEFSLDFCSLHLIITRTEIRVGY